MTGLSDADRARREAEARRLVDFGRAAAHPDGGFGWLDDHGALAPGKPVETWITSRMTHCFALAGLRGDLPPGEARRLVDHGVQALRGPLRDGRYGGWHSAVAAGGPVPGVKEGYAHAFVVLAAASATAAGHPDGSDLLAEALDVLDNRFWRETDGLMVDRCAADWSAVDPYRGVNGNMHLVEALLAAGDVTGERRWADRAERIVARVVHGFAREQDWRLPEHYDERWRAQPDYNVDVPADPFRPYGVTIGHLFEWARLALHTRTALGDDAPDWLLADAQALYGAAAARGWSVDGAPGFVYTTDFADRPVVRERMHWVVAEAVAAAWTLLRDAGASSARVDFEAWWAFAEQHVMDREAGSWHHELDLHNRPSSTVWSGKPDIYHAYQATILPLLPEAASFAGALRRADG